MSPLTEIAWKENSLVRMPQGRICVQTLAEPCSPENVINVLASIKGPVDVYCWYEGSRGLPTSGAQFMKQSIFEPLFSLKTDVKLYLYSLKGWDFSKIVTKLKTSNPLGEAIDRIHSTAVKSLYASSFFQYCTQVSKERGLYIFLNEELPKKKWLFDLSEERKRCGMTVAEFFSRQSSLFDCIQDLDVNMAYSAMQYVEGYYLIQESVNRGLIEGRKQISIAFVLPNNEGQYYVDFPKDLEKMLRADFGDTLADIDIQISFQFFHYQEGFRSRPYIGNQAGDTTVKPQEIPSYFDFLSQQQRLQS